MSQSNRPPLVLPTGYQRAPLIGGQPPQPPAAPDPDTVMRQFEESLEVAVTRDMGAQASVLTYVAVRDGLIAAGLPKEVVSLILPKIKIGVSDNFVKHPRFGGVITKFTQVMANLYQGLERHFGEDAGVMMQSMVEDRFALVMPI